MLTACSFCCFQLSLVEYHHNLKHWWTLLLGIHSRIRDKCNWNTLHIYMLLKWCFTKTSVLRALHKQLFLENLPKVASVSCLTKCDDKKMGFTVPFLDYKYVKPWKFAECVWNFFVFEIFLSRLKKLTVGVFCKHHCTQDKDVQPHHDTPSWR